MESLSQPAEHGKGLWREGPGRNGAVRTLVSPCWALAAEPPSWKLPAGPSVAAHTWNTSALSTVKLTAIPWGQKQQVFISWSEKMMIKEELNIALMAIFVFMLRKNEGKEKKLTVTFGTFWKTRQHKQIWDENKLIWLPVRAAPVWSVSGGRNAHTPRTDTPSPTWKRTWEETKLSSVFGFHRFLKRIQTHKLSGVQQLRTKAHHRHYRRRCWMLRSEVRLEIDGSWRTLLRACWRLRMHTSTQGQL